MRQIVGLVCVLAVAGCGGGTPGSPASPPGGAGCAARLSPQARMIFDAVQAGPPDGTLRERISVQTRDLVMGGSLSRSQARPAAEEAADCLRTIS